MNTVNLCEVIWRKSSYSSGEGQCVEIVFLREVVATRDSKTPYGAALAFGADTWSAFMAGIKAGAFRAAL
ncbi:DUF397 domain-containing protein [Streptomyces olivoreticuli]|uniref:DUF397 domain-containing protein n=1 Tax=Streptomyces olivoreticuli TaxID=68246 RepID=UPI00265A13E3|nr:DUF397 domain-containing protein [Streptomyces olivoreticuli]WKK22264.1 DUF397 domain-containing protein [Streptomyces olivoreticuli]